MIKSTNVRQKAISAAIGSVRAEGLRPSSKTRARLQRYADGKMSANSLRKVTVQEMRSSSKLIISR